MTGWLRNVFGSDKANDAQVAATQQAVAGQDDALAFLREQSAVPNQVRDEALRGLSDFYQVPGDPASFEELKAQGLPLYDMLTNVGRGKTQEQLIQEAMNSPLYSSIMGTTDDALSGIARYQSATGGLRSGGAKAAFGRESQRISQDALLRSFADARERDDVERNLRLNAAGGAFDWASGQDSSERALHLGGLTGLAGLTGNEGAIASLLANRGMTQAQGTLGQAQTQASATNNIFQGLLGFGQLGANAGWWSDIRLKTNIRPLGNKHGLNWYCWDWKPEAAELGLEGEASGVLAHEIYQTHPEAVGLVDGLLVVDYNKLIPEAA